MLESCAQIIVFPFDGKEIEAARKGQWVFGFSVVFPWYRQNDPLNLLKPRKARKWKCSNCHYPDGKTNEMASLRFLHQPPLSSFSSSFLNSTSPLMRLSFSLIRDLNTFCQKMIKLGRGKIKQQRGSYQRRRWRFSELCETTFYNCPISVIQSLNWSPQWTNRKADARLVICMGFFKWNVWE